jgi:hypothetical protein
LDLRTLEYRAKYKRPGGTLVLSRPLSEATRGKVSRLGGKKEKRLGRLGVRLESIHHRKVTMVRYQRQQEERKRREAREAEEAVERAREERIEKRERDRLKREAAAARRARLPKRERERLKREQSDAHREKQRVDAEAEAEAQKTWLRENGVEG